MKVAVVMVAAGRGERFGGSSKVLVPLAGRPVLVHSIATVENIAAVTSVVIVTSAPLEEAVRKLIGDMTVVKPLTVVLGGPTRQASVAAGVAATSALSDIVLVHDAARPLASTALFVACANAAARSGAAIVAIPVVDTLKRASVDHQIVETVSRADLWAAQTPQGFRRTELLDAFGRTAHAGVEFTDEASLYERLGRPVTLIPGDRTNIKITVPDDMLIAEAMLAARADPDGGDG